MAIKLQRIYSKDRQEGLRILVDRLWPRGVSKESAQLHSWFRDVAPSNNLRIQFSHEAGRYELFREIYLKELTTNPAFQRLLDLCRNNDVVLLFSATDTEHNNAVVLKEAIEREMSGTH